MLLQVQVENLVISSSVAVSQAAAKSRPWAMSANADCATHPERRRSPARMEMTRRKMMRRTILLTRYECFIII